MLLSARIRARITMMAITDPMVASLCIELALI